MSPLKEKPRLLLCTCVALGVLLPTILLALPANGSHGKPTSEGHGKDARAKVTRSKAARMVEVGPPVQVLASKFILPGKVVYRYSIVNGSAFPITRVLIGFNYDIGRPELDYAPIGWDGDSVPSTSYKSPSGWEFLLEQTEEDPKVNLSWSATSPIAEIPGGATLPGFEVTLRDTLQDWPYEGGHWAAYLNSTEQISYSGWLQPSDVSAVPLSSVFSPSGVVVTPNPARTAVSIRFEMPVLGIATIDIFDVQGRRVKQLLNERRPVGNPSVAWDGKDAKGRRVAAGTYFIRIKTPTTQRFGRVVWVHESK